MEDELALIRGMDESGSLVNIKRNAREGNLDVVVIDAAPTGETVRLLSMPDTFQWYAGRIMNLQSGTLGLARPLIKAFLPSAEILDAVNCNRVLAKSEYHDTFMQELYHNQTKFLRQIHNTFAPLPIWEAPYYPHEIIGISPLVKFADVVFGDQDPTQVYYRGKIQEVTRQGDAYILRLPLPHVEMDKVLMTRKGDEMIIEIGNFKRDITLPSVLATQEATMARFVNKALEIHFKAPAAETDVA